MTQDLSTVTQFAHAFVVSANIVIYFRYGIRGRLLVEELQGYDTMLYTIKSKIATGLNRVIVDSLNDSVEVTDILLPDGEHYMERGGNALQGERFSNRLYEFVQVQASELFSDLITANLSRKAWIGWSSAVAWWLLIATAVEVTALASGFIGEHYWPESIDDWFVYTIMSVGVYTVSILLMIGMLQLHHERLIRLRAKYEVS